MTLPDTDLAFLLAHFLEVGPVKQTGMGNMPIDWQDLLAWQMCIELKLPPWQLRLLVSMSQEYVSFSQKAEKPDCPAPWVDPMDEERRESVARRLSSAFRSLARRKKGR